MHENINSCTEINQRKYEWGGAVETFMRQIKMLNMVENLP